MKKASEIINNKMKSKVNLKVEFNKTKNDEDFNNFVNKINLSDDILCKYTSKLQDSCKEFNNCLNCKGLVTCKNEVKGYIYYPNVNDNNINFIYKPCRYMEQTLEDNSYQNHVSLFNMPTALKNAKVKDIYPDDKSRVEIILYIDEYISTYFTNRKKGLYLTGNFGSGKTYLLAALFNELAKKNVNSAIVYFPEFLRTLKDSFKEVEPGTTYSDKFNYIKHIPLLLIDDIGAENLTPWARDEILGTLLQYRMEENLPTFFTSNLTLSELEMHLSLTNNKIDSVKGRRIIERIKYLTDEMKLIGIDRRK